MTLRCANRKEIVKKSNVVGDYGAKEKIKTGRLTEQLCHPEFISGSSHRKIIPLPENINNIPFALHTAKRRVSGDYVPRKAAFTLAEVLITLGIIGVVAALTIPQLIKDYQHHVLENQFKQASSIVQQVVLLAREELGVDNLKKFCTGYEGILGELSYINSPQCIKALNYAFTRDSSMYVNSFGEHSVERDPNSMRTYNNKTVLKDYGGIAGPYALKVMRQKQNGLLVNFTIVERQVYINVDINGFDGPNQLGHDIFIFYLSDKDTLTGRKQTAVYTDEELAEMDFDEEHQRARAGNPCNRISGSSANGIGCTWFAINDIDPETGKKGYWKNLP